MEKNWNAMEKLWKSYGISFLEICTNPGYSLSLNGTLSAKYFTSDPIKKMCIIVKALSDCNLTSSASISPHFCGNPQFLFSLEILARGFLTSGKKSASNFFFVRKFFRGKNCYFKRFSANKMAAELSYARRI